MRYLKEPLMWQAWEKSRKKNNVTFRVKKVANWALVLNKSATFLKTDMRLLLLVISEREVTAARAGKVFAGKECNISCQKIC